MSEITETETPIQDPESSMERGIIPTHPGVDLQPGDGKRIRTLVPEAKAQYDEAVKKYHAKLTLLKQNVDYEIGTFKHETHSSQSVIVWKKRIEPAFVKYMNMAEEFSDFLKRKRTTESLAELKVHESICSALEASVDEVYRDMQRFTIKQAETKSVRSGSSRKSRNSRTSSAESITQFKARAEAARASLEFAAKEAELKKADADMVRQKMNIQTELEFLGKQREAAVALAEYNAVIEENSQGDVESLRGIPKEDNYYRTKQYVESQRNVCQGLSYREYVPQQTINQSRHYVQGPSLNVQTSQEHQPLDHTCAKSKVNQRDYDEHRFLDSRRSQFENVPQRETSVIDEQNVDHYESRQREQSRDDKGDDYMPMNDFTRFLLKKELLFKRFTFFNDRPESYELWKSNFIAIKEELHASPVEESELLVTYLGTESKKFAQSIRSSNVNDPQSGVDKIWKRLEERFGTAEMVEMSLKSKLKDFPKIVLQDPKRLYDLQDVLSEILSRKENSKFEKLLSYFDTSGGINPIVKKLPTPMQNKWRDKATSYKRAKEVPYPPFSFFVEFVTEEASKYNDPGLKFDSDQNNNPQSAREKTSAQFSQKTRQSRNVHTNKTEVASPQERTKPPEVKKPFNKQSPFKKLKCAVHNTNHSLNVCEAFKAMSLEDRRQIVHDNGLCYKCINSKEHLGRDCTEIIRCDECGSSRHPTGMHLFDRSEISRKHSGEDSSKTVVESKCTEICHGNFSGKSCAKIVQVYISHRNNPKNRLRAYVVLDEQSNGTLGKGLLFDKFSDSCETHEYLLRTCSGNVQRTGRRAQGLVVESLDGSFKMPLPTVIECDEIPDNRSEIPTPDIARYHEHLRDLESELLPLNSEADILLLIGRDLPDVHQILEQRTGPVRSPFAQRTMLGWVVVGDVCIDGRHPPDSVNSFKTYVSMAGRPSLLKPCPNTLSVHEVLNFKNKCDDFDCDTIKLGQSVFDRTPHDDHPGASVEDKLFMETMETGFRKDESGNWSAPLPFKPDRDKLPNNFPMAFHRAKSLDRSLKSDEKKREHFTEFMQNLIDNKHAEVAPKLKEGDESWHLPVFGVYHPKKPDKIRCVFDSSAKFGETSLNKVLLSGPDLNNSLLGVLLRFRKNRVAASADIQQMFYSFHVDEKHRDYLRFLWHRDNDFNKELICYRMTVHVFGNSPSPSVAIYGLKRCAQDADSDVREFIERHFYVDDGLISVDTSDEMISLLKRTQTTLMDSGNIRLHKFACNNEEVMSALPQQDLAQDLKDLDLESDSFPLQRSLGLYWDLSTDSFTYRISDDIKPFTRRGILSTLNSVYDPLGFVAPVLVRGKWLLRDLMQSSVSWDDPLPEQKRMEWETWRESLFALKDFSIPRMFVSSSLCSTAYDSYELHVFADASEKAIGAVAYLRSVRANGSSDVGFVMGKAKVSPQHGHTIPRLELCAAVLAVELYEHVMDNLDQTLNVVKFYTDSKVVLGYIFNQTRRFYIYVENRINRIRRSTLPEQWNFVPTSINPADQATRSVAAEDIGSSSWINGPTNFLNRDTQTVCSESDNNLVDPDSDKEIRPVVSVFKSEIETPTTMLVDKITKFSKWTSLVRAITVLRRAIKARSQKVKSKVDSIKETEEFLIRTVQMDSYRQDIECLRNGMNLRKSSSIVSLDPFLDDNDILRVGGRLNKSNWIPYEEKNPILLPGKSHLAIIIVEHFHSQVKHQGRHFTEGAVRSAGFWITGLKRLVSSVIHRCVTCRKLRGRLEVQHMADLPPDRIEPTPPFTNVGVDAFGPWTVVHRRTRGGCANSKRWAILFTCLTTRAIHIEVVDEMSSSAFINAVRRFIAIRGKVKLFRSDRGTNFVGATDALQVEAINVEDTIVKNYLTKSNAVWLFNAPHASNMGGAWERLIGVTRRILDAILLESKVKFLTHDVLVTFMAEVSSIVNHRPITPVSTDKDNPFVLSPAILLTQKHPSDNMEIVEEFDEKDLLRSEWKRVMVLSDRFWARWRREYLSTLQCRRKWTSHEPNVKEGDVILLKDKTLVRNEWPMGIVTRTFPSDDDKVRKTEIRIIRDGKPVTYIRPISELVVLVSD